jgi:ribosome biogenesis GTPase / thiamine phosphate phosphatase
VSLSSSASFLSDLGWGSRWTALLAEVAPSETTTHPIDGFDPVGLRPGRVVRRDRGSALVATGDETLAVPAAGADLAVGDWVALDGDRLAAVLPRHGVLRRRGPDGVEQVLAANVDVVLLVCGLDRPVRPGRIHRGVVQAWDAGAGVVVVLTKSDLAGDPAAIMAGLLREAPGVDVIPASSRTGEGLEAVRVALTGRTAVLVGESGAGKSTLLNALAGRVLAETGAVRAGDAKGRHTTSRRELHIVAGLGQIVDTPGLRAFGLAAESSAVDAAFGDIDALAASCRFRDCRHDGEPACAVAAAVEEGVLSHRRLEQYHHLQHELASELLRSNPHEHRRVVRRFSRQVRDVYRLKGRDD